MGSRSYLYGQMVPSIPPSQPSASSLASCKSKGLLPFLVSTAAILLAAGSLLPLHGAEPEATPVAPSISFAPKLQLKSDERTVLERYIGHATKYAGELTPEKVKKQCAESPEMFAWVEFPNLNCLLDAYALTGDTKYLDTFKQAFGLFSAILEKGDDGYLGWWGKPVKGHPGAAEHPDAHIDELQMSFRCISILSRWVEMARRTPAYAESNKAVISEYLDLMEKQLFPKWDARGFFADLKSDGGVYRGLDYPLSNEKAPGFTLSHEKCSIVVEGLLNLYRVTKNDLYMRRAIQLGTRYKHCLSLKDGHYEWMSWEPGGTWDVSPTKPDAWIIPWIAPDPNGEWYAAALSIAVNLYQHGVVFGDEDMARFIATQKTQCWNGDFAAPQYRTVGGASSADSKYIVGRFLSYPIALYDADLSRLAFDGPHEGEVLEQSVSPWKGGTARASYVRAKYLLRPSIGQEKQPFAGFGKAFLANPENRAFYEKLKFTVVAPGKITPLKPSQMFPANPAVPSDKAEAK